MKRAGFRLGLAWLLAWLGVMPAWAASPRELIEQGNAHYAAGRYAEALQAYEQAESLAGDRYQLELLHNRAAALYKLGRLEDARELWARARDLGDARYEAQALYNLGNCHYAAATEALARLRAPSQPPTGDQAAAGEPSPAAPTVESVLGELDVAIERYREALKLDPELDNARANLELAHNLKEFLLNQPQDCNQNGIPDGQDIADGTSADENGNGVPDECEQSCSQPSPDSQPSRQDQPPQSQPSSRPSQAFDQQDQQSGGQEQQPDQAQQDRQGEQDRQEPQSGDQQDQKGQESSSEESSKQPRSEQKAQQEEGQAGGQPAQRMSAAEAERLLQMIRDMEKARRQILRQREQAKYQPVDRDW